MSNHPRLRILVADDEPSQRSILKEILLSEGHDVEIADGVDSSMELFHSALRDKPFDLVVTDLKMPGGTEGLELLRRTKEDRIETEVVLMTAYSEVRSAVEAMKLGAFEYLPKPFERERLLHIVNQIAEKVSLVRENSLLREIVRTKSAPGKMIGNSAPMARLFDMIGRVAQTNTTCLIRGESGTGKELVARAIHDASPNESEPFIAINCAAIPDTLIESELFGHEKGTFTGASTAKSGRFEEVGRGTLFLDEIGSMKYDLQARLLRVLQEREFSRVGSSRLVPFKGRILAATALDLEKSIRNHTFREDLYFRLNVVPLVVPPLRDRQEDIPLLVEHFLKSCNERVGRDIKAVTPGVMEAFERYSWPGNVRELENAIERMTVLSDRDYLDETLMPVNIRDNSAFGEADLSFEDDMVEFDDSRLTSIATPRMTPQNGNAESSNGDEEIFHLPAEGVVMGNLEADLIRQALARSRGRIEPAARLLGVSYKTLQYRIKKYDLRTTQDVERKKL